MSFICCPVCGADRARPVVTLEAVPVLCNRLGGRGLGPRGPPRDACARDLRGVRAYVEHRVRAGPDHLRPVLRYQLAPLGRLPRLRRRAGAAAGRGARAPRCAGSRDGVGPGRFPRATGGGRGGAGDRFDPSFRGDAAPGVAIRATLFDPEVTEERVTSSWRATSLSILADPRGALATLLSVLDPDGAQAVDVEVPNALWTLTEGGVWDLIYEHFLLHAGFALAPRG